MKIKAIFTLIVSAFITLSANAYAADVQDQATKDQDIVVGACMTVNLQKKIPGITDAKITECSNGESSALPKCLGLSDADFTTLLNTCKSQLKNAICVAGKLKVTLYQYADCGYEKDPESCYKQ